MYLHWTRSSIDHLAKHDVTPDEAAEVFRGVRRPWPDASSGGRFRIWGKTRAGRYLQIVFIYRPVDDIDMEDVPLPWRHDVFEMGVVPMVIHARDLTPDEKRQYRRRA
jgi:uncharacterized DUF497 family protein